MRSVLLAVLGVTLLAAGAAGPARPVGRCPTSAGMADASKPTKPSSFEPQPKPYQNAYGAPVGNRILTRHVKKKAAPQLHTAPLPDPG
jgi:hypothetical protein